MASVPTSRQALKLLLSTRPQSIASKGTPPFFQPSSHQFSSLPFFYSSRLPPRTLTTRTSSFFTPSLPSTPFLSLRSAFHTSSVPPSRSLSTRRSFTSSALVKGIRPYYGRGGSSGGGGRRPSGWKDRINSIEPVWILGGLIVVNVGVFSAWAYGTELLQRFHDSTWLRFLQRHFTVSWQNITQGRVWTLLTSAFSHEGTGHLIFNMATLFFMAPPVMAMLGNVGFLSLYIFSGLSASTFSLLFNHFVTQNPQYAAHGASGATYGTIAFFAAAMPRATFLIFFLLPVPAWLCVSGIFAWDFYNATSRRGGMTDSAGHVGGIASGLLFFLRRIGRI